MGFRTLEGDICSTEMVVPLFILEVFVIILNGVLALPGDTTQLYCVKKWGFLLAPLFGLLIVE